MVRSVFRIVEFTEGLDGYSMHHEWTLYVFDSLPMFAVMVLYFIWYPTMIDEARKMAESGAGGTFAGDTSASELGVTQPVNPGRKMHQNHDP